MQIPETAFDLKTGESGLLLNFRFRISVSRTHPIAKAKETPLIVAIKISPPEATLMKDEPTRTTRNITHRYQHVQISII